MRSCDRPPQPHPLPRWFSRQAFLQQDQTVGNQHEGVATLSCQHLDGGLSPRPDPTATWTRPARFPSPRAGQKPASPLSSAAHLCPGFAPGTSKARRGHCLRSLQDMAVKINSKLISVLRHQSLSLFSPERPRGVGGGIRGSPESVCFSPACFAKRDSIKRKTGRSECGPRRAPPSTQGGLGVIGIIRDQPSIPAAPYKAALTHSHASCHPINPSECRPGDLTPVHKAF